MPTAETARIKRQCPLRRKFRRASLPFIFALISSCSNTTGAALISESQAREIARTTVQTGTEHKETFFSVHRREDLEDNLCWFITLGTSAPPIPSCVFLFEVSDQGYEFKDGKADFHLSIHGPFIYYVAVSQDYGDVFRISGFKDSRDEFDRMAKAFHIRVSDDSDALRYSELYHDVDPTNLRLELPKSNLELKQLAEKRFFESFYPDFRTAESHFDQWWKNAREGLVHQSLGSIVSKTSSGYLVTFLTMSDMQKRQPDGGPSLLKASVEISTSGQVTGPTLAPVPTP